MRQPLLPALALLPLLSCAEGAAWDGRIQCTFYNGVEHLELIDTLVCVEGGGEDCSDEPWSQDYGTWAASVSLVDSDYEGQSISITVQPLDDEGAALNGGMTVLYQLDGAPENEFVGGHGFTGLHYVRHPEQDDTFQFFCEAP